MASWQDCATTLAPRCSRSGCFKWPRNRPDFTISVIAGCSSSARCRRTLCFTCATSANCSRRMRLPLLALASTKLPSNDGLSPSTSLASKQRATISSNSCSNSFDSWNRPCRFLENVEWCGISLIEAQTGKPAPGQMHAQLLHQLAFAGDAVQIADQQDAQCQLGTNRGPPGLAVALLQSLAHNRAASETAIPSGSRRSAQTAGRGRSIRHRAPYTRMDE